MPRLSADAIAQKAMQSGGSAPEPPKCLKWKAKALWISICASRPADFFRPGALELLKEFCRRSVIIDDLLDDYEQNPSDVALLDIIDRHSRAVSSLAVKLRLSVQADVRGDRAIVKEKGPAKGSLLGGKALRIVS